MGTVHKLKLTGLLLAGAVAMTGNQALAGGFSIREQSASGLGMAFAGAAAGYDDLSSMFFNPATVSLQSGTQFTVDSSLIIPFSKAKNGSAAAVMLTPAAHTGSASSGNIGVLAVVPSTYASYQLSPKVNFGMSINAPFGLSTKADAGWVGRYHGVESAIKTINVNPVISYKLSPMLSVAGGPMLQYFDVKLTSAIDVSAFTGEAGDGFGTTKGNDLGFGFTLGALFQPTPTTRIGIGFRSAVKHKLKGTSIATAPAGTLRFTAGVLPLLNTSIKAKVTTPETVSLGLRQQVSEKLALTGAVEWANWSRFKELRIDFASAASDSVTTENWKDSWYLAFGGEYKWSNRTTLRLGAAYEKSPVPDSTRTPRLPDNDRIWLTAGAGYKVRDWLSVNASLAHIFVKTAEINLPATAAVGDENRRRGTLLATFKGNINIASVSAKIHF
jgi:long-chain fatty acid transport protein